MDTYNNEEMNIQLNILTQVSVSVCWMYTTINCNCVIFFFNLFEKLLDLIEFKRYILTYVSYDEVETIYEKA